MPSKPRVPGLTTPLTQAPAHQIGKLRLIIESWPDRQEQLVHVAICDEEGNQVASRSGELEAVMSLDWRVRASKLVEEARSQLAKMHGVSAGE